ncbi:MFS transporter [Dyadobacter frigoris]|uniref:2-dehydro-3-deoxygalactonokinase n=1 Tax=Dyadobacter frigoris TaxID=2576211 RepID=UPI0024A460E8|nr:2-dehydro-3-deoxygalactonokinase [Dyadobacter frigoris]GLU53819.1 MFS transporter [Dyadobacter frigoris]
MKNYLLCCDWGTSSFRLRLIEIADYKLLGEIVTLEGIASIFNAWQTSLVSGNIGRDQFFREYLKTQIDILATRLSFNMDGIAIVISGMASSSIGMEEIPYSPLPYPTDGSQADIRSFEAPDDFQHEIILISGVKSETDVMRGEETQLVGLLDLEELYAFRNKEAIFIFPGTHSKHMYVKENQLVNFQTFMTGEVFNIMTNFSILKDSVENRKENKLTTYEVAAFKKGIGQAGYSNLLNSLFKVRTNQLFDKMSKSENACYLSGLLIGNELKHLKEYKSNKLILCSGNNLYELYKLAVEELGLSDRTTTISADLINKATIAGQIKIYQNQTLKLNNTNS